MRPSHKQEVMYFLFYFGSTGYEQDIFKSRNGDLDFGNPEILLRQVHHLTQSRIYENKVIY